MDGQHMTYDEEYALSTNEFHRTGYTFVGWTDDPDELEEVLYCDGVVVSNLAAEVDGVYDLYAVWQANVYSVRFDANGGSGAMSDQSMVYDAEAPLDTNAFVKTGYSFVGWANSTSGSVVYDNGAIVSNLTAEADAVVTLHAKWSANSYTVKFNANGGTGSMANEPMTYNASKALTANAFTRTGYVFAGWAKTATGSVSYADKASVKNLTAPSGGTVNLYARWTPNGYTVRYDANGGKGTMPGTAMTYDVPAALAANAFTRTGYRFAGWSKTAGGSVEYAESASVSNLTYVANGSVTLYAKWTANTYSVKFDANGGRGSMANQSYVYDTAFARVG